MKTTTRPSSPSPASWSVNINHSPRGQYPRASYLEHAWSGWIKLARAIQGVAILGVFLMTVLPIRAQDLVQPQATIDYQFEPVEGGDLWSYVTFAPGFIGVIMWSQDGVVWSELSNFGLIGNDGPTRTVISPGPGSGFPPYYLIPVNQPVIEFLPAGTRAKIESTLPIRRIVYPFTTLNFTKVCFATPARGHYRIQVATKPDGPWRDRYSAYGGTASSACWDIRLNSSETNQVFIRARMEPVTTMPLMPPIPKSKTVSPKDSTK